MTWEGVDSAGERKGCESECCSSVAQWDEGPRSANRRGDDARKAVATSRPGSCWTIQLHLTTRTYGSDVEAYGRAENILQREVTKMRMVQQVSKGEGGISFRNERDVPLASGT